MIYDVHLTETFQKSIKALRKKYPHVKDDLLIHIKALEEDPSAGDPIPGWKKEVWKVRVASSDVKKRKRGGYRLIYVKTADSRLRHPIFFVRYSSFESKFCCGRWHALGKLAFK